MNTEPSDRSADRGATWVVPMPTPPVVPGYTTLFSPCVTDGRHVAISGRLAKLSGQVLSGRVGEDVSFEAAVESARGVALELLGSLRDAAGDLGRVSSLGRLFVAVRVADSFSQPHAVANAISEVLLAVLGERGRHARTAIGVSQLPFGACVEAELSAYLKD